MKTNTLNIKNYWVWRPTLKELKVIEYEGQHFQNYKWLSMKANSSWTKNNCVWMPTFHELKVNVYEGLKFLELNLMEYESQYFKK